MDPANRSTGTSAVTVLLTRDQIATLDEMSAAIRRNTGVAISRSAVLRALATAALPHRNQWLRCRSEEHLVQRVAQVLNVGFALQAGAK